MIDKIEQRIEELKTLHNQYLKNIEEMQNTVIMIEGALIELDSLKSSLEGEEKNTTTPTE